VTRHRRLAYLVTACLILAGLAPPASAGPGVALVDGAVHRDVLLLRTEDGFAILQRIAADDDGNKSEAPDTFRVPVRSLVAADLTARPETPSPDPFNLYRAGGDRLRGKVEGSGEEVTVVSKAVAGLKLPLSEVEAICLGTFFGQVQTNYRDLFEDQRAEGRAAVVVNRGSKPFSFRADVLEIRKDALFVRMGEQERELARDKVYGFVRRGGEIHPPADDVVLVRMVFVDGGRITLPLESIDAATIRAGGAVVQREGVVRLEFSGSHVAHLSAMEPVSVEETALFGKAPRWRRDEMVLGGPLRLRGTVYRLGIGVQAKSRIEFALGGRWNRLFVRCGIDDAASREGQAEFRVFGDGKLIKEISRRKGDEPAVLHLDIAGVDRLVLEVLPGESYTSDLCDWAEARVYAAEGTGGSGGAPGK